MGVAVGTPGVGVPHCIVSASHVVAVGRGAVGVDVLTGVAVLPPGVWVGGTAVAVSVGGRAVGVSDGGTAVGVLVAGGVVGVGVLGGIRPASV